MKLKFTKMQGCGNDYIYIDCFEQEVSDPSLLATKLSDRHFSVGGDGVILICPSDKADCKMRIFNLDGSEGNMCGNGIRCVAKYMYERRKIDADSLTVETKSGVKQLSLSVENGNVNAVTVDMGMPSFDCESIPVVSDKAEMINEEATVNGKKYILNCVSMGNPHCVIFCDDIEEIDVCKAGKELNECGIFPEGVNVEFAELLDERNFKMRVFERGSGETLACGTGACAVASVATRLGEVAKGKTIKVKLLGGELDIVCDEHIFMSGNAEFVFDGEIDI